MLDRVRTSHHGYGAYRCTLVGKYADGGSLRALCERGHGRRARAHRDDPCAQSYTYMPVAPILAQRSDGVRFGAHYVWSIQPIQAQRLGDHSGAGQIAGCTSCGNDVQAIGQGERQQNALVERVANSVLQFCVGPVEWLQSHLRAAGDAVQEPLCQGGLWRGTVAPHGVAWHCGGRCVVKVACFGRPERGGEIHRLCGIEEARGQQRHGGINSGDSAHPSDPCNAFAAHGSHHPLAIQPQLTASGGKRQTQFLVRVCDIWWRKAWGAIATTLR